MADRIFSGNDISSGAGTKTVTFTNPYKSVNYAVGITAKDMATGDFFLVEIKLLMDLMLHLKIQVEQQVSKHLILLQKGFKRSIRNYGTTRLRYSEPIFPSL